MWGMGAVGRQRGEAVKTGQEDSSSAGPGALRLHPEGTGKSPEVRLPLSCHLLLLGPQVHTPKAPGVTGAVAAPTCFSPLSFLREGKPGRPLLLRLWQKRRLHGICTPEPSWEATPAPT